MLVRMWSKGNSPPLLLGLQICTSTVEMKLAVFLKTENSPTSRPSYAAPGHIHKRCSPSHETPDNLLHSIVVGARNWKQPRCLSNKDWIKKMFYMFAWYVLTCKWRLDIRNRILLLHSTNLKKLHMKDGTSKDA